MREVSCEKIIETVKRLCIESCYELPADVYEAIKKAAAAERSPRAKNTLKLLLENADIAKNEHIPICQDTGLAVVFVEQGTKCQIVSSPERADFNVIDAINEGVRQGYDEGLLRKSGDMWRYSVCRVIPSSWHNVLTFVSGRPIDAIASRNFIGVIL